MRGKILAALADGPRSITDLAGGSMSHSVRAPIRAAVDRLVEAGAVRRTSIGLRRLFALTEWRVTDAWLLEYLLSQMVREDKHLVWPGAFDRWQRAVIRVDGQRVDVRRELYRLQRGRALRTRDSVRARCEHEQCMAAACLAVTRPKGRRQSVAARQKMATAKRAKSKWDAETVAAVKASELPYKQIARETGMAPSTVGAIKSGRLWQDYRNPWAGLASAQRQTT